MGANYVPTFSPIYDRMVAAAWQRPRYILSEGGTRSGKTYAALQLLYFLANKDKHPSINSVVSETFPHLKRGAMRDFQHMFGDAWRPENWSKSESVYTCPESGSVIEFFSADTPAKVHGPARKRLFLNEIQNIDYDTARQLFVRTEGLILLDYNPTRSFWGNEQIEPRDNCIKIHSTYKDNPYLSAEQIAEIESNRGDVNWWRVYGEGKVGQLEGLIFPDFEQVDALPEVTDGMIDVYGLDFGFTNDPSVLLHILIDTRKRELWVDELFYRTGMLNADMAQAARAENVGRRAIYADSAEPKTCEEMRRYGLNVIGAYKATRKAEQLQALKAYALKITKRSVNTIREARGYTWQRTGDGQWLNEPIAFQDHAMDALRYGAFPNLPQFQQTTRFSRT